MSKPKIEQYSEASSEFANLAEDIIKNLKDIWESETGKWIPIVYLRRGPNREFVTFSPKLRNSDNEEVLGYCEYLGGAYQIILSEDLLSESVSYETFKEVVSHEFAHFIDGIVYQHFGHDKTFKEICKVLGIENDQAFMKHSLSEVSKTSNVLEKVKKLLALSESPNMNEAQAALLKAKQLMREYGISDRQNSQEKIYRVALTDYKNYTTEISVILQIIRRMSNCWLLLSDNKAYAHGTYSECEIASYLFDYLKIELNKLYQTAKREGRLSYGAKKSFYLGAEREILKRFDIQDAEKGSKDIVNYEFENEDSAKKFIYPSLNLSKKKLSGQVSDYQAYYYGTRAGQNLRIRNGVTSSSSNETLYLN